MSDSDDAFIAFIVMLIVSIIITFISAAIFMWLWNVCLVLAITVANPISYWTAFGLIVLFGIPSIKAKAKSD
jgi:uncharacterized membrane protein